MNKQHEVFTISLRHVINTNMKICANVYVRYRYRTIQSVLSFHFHYRQLCYPCHFIFSSELDICIIDIVRSFG